MPIEIYAICSVYALLEAKHSFEPSGTKITTIAIGGKKP